MPAFDPERRAELVLKAGCDLMEHVSGFAAIHATVIMLIEPVCGDQAKTQRNDTAHCNKRLVTGCEKTWKLFPAGPTDCHRHNYSGRARFLSLWRGLIGSAGNRWCSA